MSTTTSLAFFIYCPVNFMNFLPEHSPLEVRDIARTLAAKLKGLSKIFNYSNICENVQSGEIIGKLNIL